MTALLQGINTAANIKSKRAETKRLQAESRARLDGEGYDEQGYRVDKGLADVKANLYKGIGRQYDTVESNDELKNKQRDQIQQVLTTQLIEMQKEQMLYLSDKALTETISPLTQNGNIDPAPMNLLLRSNNKVREVFLQKFGISGFTEFIPTSQEHKQAAINDGLISNEATDEQLAQIQKNYMVSYGPDGKLDTKSGHELAVITGLNPKRMTPKTANAYNEIYSNANKLLASTENINPNDLNSGVSSNPVKDNSQEIAQVQKSLSDVLADSNKTAEEKVAQIGSMVAAIKGAYNLGDLAKINASEALTDIKASDKGEDTRSAKERGVDRQTNFRNRIRKAAKKAGTPFPEYVLNPENKYDADLITGIKNWSPKLTDEQLKQIDFSGRIAALGGAAINLETYETGIINANIKKIQKYVRLYKGKSGGQVSIKAFNKLLNTFMVKALGSQQTKVEIENYKRTIGDDRNTRASIFGGLYLAIKNEKTSLENLMRSLPSPEYAAATTLPTTLKKYNVLLTELVVELKDLGEAVEKNVYDVDNSETPTKTENKDQPTFSGARDNFQTKTKSKSKTKPEPEPVSVNTVDKRVANKLKSGGF